jgi:cation transport protein ChaC
MLPTGAIRPIAAPPAEEAVRAIAQGVGTTGANRDYLLNTVAQLRALGVRDSGLERIAALLPAAPARALADE